MQKDALKDSEVLWAVNPYGEFKLLRSSLGQIGHSHPITMFRPQIGLATKRQILANITPSRNRRETRTRRVKPSGPEIQYDWWTGLTPGKVRQRDGTIILP